MAERFVLETLFKASGNLVRQLTTNSRAMQGFARTSNRAMQLVRRGSIQAGKGIDRLGNRYTSLVTGVGAAKAGQFLFKLEDQMDSLGRQSDRSTEKMDMLKRKIFEVAQAPDIRLDPAALIEGVDKIVNKTGDLDFATDNLRTLALAIKASTSRGQDIGALVTEFLKLDINEEVGILRALDTLTLQGKAGAFTLQNLATQGERAVSAFAGLGFKGPDAVRELGALLQVARIGTGGPEQAVTAFEAVLRSIRNNAEKLQATEGITIFEPGSLEKFRPIREILLDIFTKAQGRPTLLGKVFDSEALRGVNTLIVDFNRNGTLKTLDDFFKIQGDGATLMRDSARAAKTASSAYESVATTIKSLADETLTGPMREVADFVNSQSEASKITAVKTGAVVGGGLITAAALQKLPFRTAPGLLAAGGLLSSGAGRVEGGDNRSLFQRITGRFSGGGAASTTNAPEAKLVIEIKDGQRDRVVVKNLQSKGFGSIDITNGPNVVVP